MGNRSQGMFRHGDGLRTSGTRLCGHRLLRRPATSKRHVETDLSGRQCRTPGQILLTSLQFSALSIEHIVEIGFPQPVTGSRQLMRALVVVTRSAERRVPALLAFNGRQPLLHIEQGIGNGLLHANEGRITLEIGQIDGGLPPTEIEQRQAE